MSLNHNLSTPRDIVTQLEIHGSTINEEAVKGCEISREIIHYYKMWHKCPGDPGSQAIVKMNLQKWLNKYVKLQ